MKLLFDDTLAPITSEMAFFETDINSLLGAFVAWESRIMTPLGIRVIERAVQGSLREVLLELLPLTGPRPRRYLFLPTAGSWVWLVENSSAGTDAGTLASFLSQDLGCRAIRTAAVPHTKTKEDRSTGGRYGACIFELFGPGGEPRGHLRSVALVNDGGKWTFEQYGDPLPFERVENYNRRKIVDRFTFEDLRDCASALGIRCFEEDFYRPEGARIVELVGPKPKGMTEFTLEKARATF